MKFKYYLRGAGFGIITATIILTIAFLFQDTMTDAEIMERASQLGMVMGSREDTPETLADISKEGASQADLETKTDENGIDETADAGSTNKTEASVKPDAPDQTNASDQTNAPDSTNKAEGTNKTNTSDKTDGTSSQPPASDPDAQKQDPQQPAGSTPDSKENTGSAGEKTGGSKSGQDSQEAQGSAGKADSAGKTDSAGKNKDTGKVIITIEAGDVSRIVSGKVKDAGLVNDQADFNAFLGDNGYDNQLQPGTYELKKGMTFREIADILTAR